MQLFDLLGRPINIGDRVLAIYTITARAEVQVHTITSISKDRCHFADGAYKYPQRLIVIDAQLDDNLATYPELFI